MGNKSIKSVYIPIPKEPPCSVNYSRSADYTYAKHERGCVSNTNLKYLEFRYGKTISISIS